MARLVEPVTAGDVYRALVAAGLRIETNTASTGGPSHDPIKVILGSYEGWPLAIGEWSSGDALRSAYYWKPGAKPGKGEAPIEFMGLNVLIQWGPFSSGTPKFPSDEQTGDAVRLRDALVLLIPPLSSRTIVPLPTPASSSSAPSIGAPASAKPSAKPGATPKPTKK